MSKPVKGLKDLEKEHFFLILIYFNPLKENNAEGNYMSVSIGVLSLRITNGFEHIHRSHMPALLMCVACIFSSSTFSRDP